MLLRASLVCKNALDLLILYYHAIYSIEYKNQLQNDQCCVLIFIVAINCPVIKSTIHDVVFWDGSRFHEAHVRNSVFR